MFGVSFDYPVESIDENFFTVEYTTTYEYKIGEMWIRVPEIKWSYTVTASDYTDFIVELGNYCEFAFPLELITPWVNIRNLVVTNIKVTVSDTNLKYIYVQPTGITESKYVNIASMLYINATQWYDYSGEAYLIINNSSAGIFPFTGPRVTFDSSTDPMAIIVQSKFAKKSDITSSMTRPEVVMKCIHPGTLSSTFSSIVTYEVNSYRVDGSILSLLNTVKNFSPPLTIGQTNTPPTTDCIDETNITDVLTYTCNII